jgi:hypothetical protein
MRAHASGSHPLLAAAQSGSPAANLDSGWCSWCGFEMPCIAAGARGCAGAQAHRALRTAQVYCRWSYRSPAGFAAANARASYSQRPTIRRRTAHQSSQGPRCPQVAACARGRSVLC